MRTKQVHISQIKRGDAVLHGGYVRTVGRKDLSYCSFMGIDLFGDSYHLGYKPVTLVLLDWRDRER